MRSIQDVKRLIEEKVSFWPAGGITRLGASLSNSYVWDIAQFYIITIRKSMTYPHNILRLLLNFELKTGINAKSHQFFLTKASVKPLLVRRRISEQS